VTAQGSAAGAPAQGLWGRIARMVAVAGTCAMVLFGLGINAAAGAEKAPSSRYGEYLVKAAFLYNFAKFTEWPSEAYADASAPLMVCVLGQDPFGKALDSLAGKRINGRRVALSRLARVEEAVQCQLVFISESEEGRVPGIVGYLAGRPVLTVCNAPGCTRFRGIIHLRVVSERIRFAIDIDSAKSAGLKLSSKLLALAEKFARKAKTQVSQRRSSG
jgi:hypothetical protein